MQMEGSYVITVVITGLVVVFLGLILLIGFVYLIGKFFEFIKIRKTSQTQAKETAVEVKAAPTTAPAPQIEDGINDETVAVIAAAVAAMSPDYKLTGIKKSSQRTSRRTTWGNKGLSESTSIF